MHIRYRDDFFGQNLSRATDGVEITGAHFLAGVQSLATHAALSNQANKLIVAE